MIQINYGTLLALSDCTNLALCYNSRMSLPLRVLPTELACQLAYLCMTLLIFNILTFVDYSQISLNSEDSSQVIAPVTYALDGEGIAESVRQADNAFTINATSGEIFQLKALDRDLPHGQPLWRLNAYAKSSQTGKTLGYADIVVRLRDINDKTPTFNQSLYTTAIAENASEHQHVTTVYAEDLDDPQQDGNAQVTYSIEQNQVDPSGRLIFAIDSSSGLISTAVCCLDRERRDNYTIRVAATDGGGLKVSTHSPFAILTFSFVSVINWPALANDKQSTVEIYDYMSFLCFRTFSMFVCLVTFLGSTIWSSFTRVYKLLSL